ncbi:hypothetical protein HWV62_580 [Athelia sp. TMB]|nr:hypothetical protein HWV62_580 [Athelia sp. TMB]
MASSGPRGIIPRTRAPGRGRGRGGRGRGHMTANVGANVPLDEGSSSTMTNSQSSAPAKPRLTHFISLPLGNHTGLRSKIAAFTDGLLRSEIPIAGLHESIIINPRRLHLTLGVMALAPSGSPPAAIEPSASTPSKTLSAARDLLASLQPGIKAILDDGGRDRRLKVKLNRMDLMKPERQKGMEGTYGRVLWVGPDMAEEDMNTRQLREVCSFINKQFLNAGLAVDEHRPLKDGVLQVALAQLHCTIINTAYRKPRPKSYMHNLPFSYSDILASSSYRALAPAMRGLPIADPAHVSGPLTEQRAGGGAQKIRQDTGVSVDLGVWEVGEVQICEMGSHGPEDEYPSERVLMNNCLRFKQKRMPKSMESELPTRKVIAVGDMGCGKTCFLMNSSSGSFPIMGAPAVCANQLVAVRGTSIVMVDTHHQEEYERLRPLVYVDADVLLLCFSVDSPDSLWNIKDRVSRILLLASLN